MAEQFFFGQHKGVALPEIPAGYLRWALTTLKLSSGLRGAVVAELERRGQHVPASPPVRAPECPRCRHGKTLTYRWLQTRNGTRQIRTECLACGAFCGFAPQQPPYTTEADEHAS